MPVTLPLLAVTLTVASVLLHVPPPGLFVNVVIAPGHTVSTPLIVAGAAFTVIDFCAYLLPQALLTV